VIALLGGRQAKAELGEIGSYIAIESGNVAIADRLVGEVFGSVL
jgi:hypothetical protein